MCDIFTVIYQKAFQSAPLTGCAHQACRHVLTLLVCLMNMYECMFQFNVCICGIAWQYSNIYIVLGLDLLDCFLGFKNRISQDRWFVVTN